jgi:hypothetical protein
MPATGYSLVSLTKDGLPRRAPVVCWLTSLDFRPSALVDFGYGYGDSRAYLKVVPFTLEGFDSWWGFLADDKPFPRETLTAWAAERRRAERKAAKAAASA